MTISAPISPLLHVLKPELKQLSYNPTSIHYLTPTAYSYEPGLIRLTLQSIDYLPTYLPTALSNYVKVVS